MTIVYDPTGILPGNLVSNEIHTPITEPDIYPTQGPFYIRSLTVTGTLASNGSSVPLNQYVDYVLSPMFASRSADTGKEVYSYILLIDRNKWTAVHLTYQATGGSTDTILAAQIAAAGNFDRTNLDQWLAFAGDMVALSVPTANYNLKNTGVAYLFGSKLDVIAEELRIPSSYADFIESDYIPLRATVAALQTQVSSWAASFTNNGTFSGDWITQNGMDTAIGAALTAYVPHVALTGQATTDTNNVVTLSNTAVIGKVLTGLASAAGTIVAGDSILSAIGKIIGNLANKLNARDPWVSGTLCLDSGTSINAVGIGADYNINLYSKGAGWVIPNKLRTIQCVEAINWQNSSGVTVIDLSLATAFFVNITTNTSFSFINFPAGGDLISFTIITRNDGTSGRAVAFPSSVQWANGVIPPRTTGAWKADVWTFLTHDAGITIPASLSIADVWV